MTQPYPLTGTLLTPGTRKRLPQSGFVQTGLWEASGDVYRASRRRLGIAARHPNVRSQMGGLQVFRHLDGLL